MPSWPRTLNGAPLVNPRALPHEAEGEPGKVDLEPRLGPMNAVPPVISDVVVHWNLDSVSCPYAGLRPRVVGGLLILNACLTSKAREKDSLVLRA